MSLYVKPYTSRVLNVIRYTMANTKMWSVIAASAGTWQQAAYLFSPPARMSIIVRKPIDAPWMPPQIVGSGVFYGKRFILVRDAA